MRIIFFTLAFMQFFCISKAQQDAAPRLLSCNSDEQMTQGVWGILSTLEVTQNKTTSKAETTFRDTNGIVYIYPLLKKKDLNPIEGQNNVYEMPNNPLVLSFAVGEEGCWRAQLPVGEYSMLLRYGSHVYAEYINDDREVAPFKVHKDQVSEVGIFIYL